MADYLTDEEQAERLKAWWEKNGTTLVVALVVAVGVVIGWRYYHSYTEDRANAASEAFRGYVEARTAAEPVDEYLALLDGEYQGTAYHVFALLYRAADQVGEEDWEEALAWLERAVELASDRNLADMARYRAAKLLYQLDRLDECTAVLGQIKAPGLAAPVAELSGDLAVARGDLDAALAAYRTAVDEAERDPAQPIPGLALLELKLASLVTPVTSEAGESSDAAAPPSIVATPVSGDAADEPAPPSIVVTPVAPAAGQSSDAAASPSIVVTPVSGDAGDEPVAPSIVVTPVAPTESESADAAEPPSIVVTPVTEPAP